MAAPDRIGPYAVIGTLGEGGMGVVYHARREDLDHDVAVKVLRPELRADPLVRARFQREAKAAAAAAGHPGLVAVHDAGTDDGVDWCAMDYVDGRSLEEEIAGGELSPVRAAALVEQVARALDYIHGLGILHRDLKPANVLVTTSGRALLTDFGLASVRSTGPE
ncbi:MAG: serine/threonine-protein kinase, partial [Planctomycetota bacterium]